MNAWADWQSKSLFYVASAFICCDCICSLKSTILIINIFAYLSYSSSPEDEIITPEILGLPSSPSTASYSSSASLMADSPALGPASFAAGGAGIGAGVFGSGGANDPALQSVLMPAPKSNLTNAFALTSPMPAPAPSSSAYVANPNISVKPAINPSMMQSAVNPSLQQSQYQPAVTQAGLFQHTVPTSVSMQQPSVVSMLQQPAIPPTLPMASSQPSVAAALHHQSEIQQLQLQNQQLQHQLMQAQSELTSTQRMRESEKARANELGDRVRELTTKLMV